MTNGYEQARHANCNRLNFKEKKKEGKEKNERSKEGKNEEIGRAAL